MLKPLPTSIQTFCDLINGGYLYIDKTQYLYELVRYPKGVYFLARPRRFGKSLLISTVDEIFQGNKELFKGLWLTLTAPINGSNIPSFGLISAAIALGMKQTWKYGFTAT
ncbi:AAA family ATPase [Desulfobulbus sp. US2]|nr:AAA family ATPase [Desulfobulbus sp. US2]